MVFVSTLHDELPVSTSRLSHISRDVSSTGWSGTAAVSEQHRFIPPAPPAPPSPPESGHASTLHIGSHKRARAGAGILQHSSATLPHRTKPKMVPAELSHFPAWKRSALDYQSILSRPYLSDGGMDGSDWRSSGSDVLGGQEHGGLSRSDISPRSILSDPDFRLSSGRTSRPRSGLGKSVEFAPDVHQRTYNLKSQTESHFNNDYVGHGQNNIVDYNLNPHDRAAQLLALINLPEDRDYDLSERYEKFCKPDPAHFTTSKIGTKNSHFRSVSHDENSAFGDHGLAAPANANIRQNRSVTVAYSANSSKSPPHSPLSEHNGLPAALTNGDVRPGRAGRSRSPPLLAVRPAAAGTAVAVQFREKTGGAADGHYREKSADSGNLPVRSHTFSAGAALPSSAKRHVSLYEASSTGPSGQKPSGNSSGVRTNPHHGVSGSGGSKLAGSVSCTDVNDPDALIREFEEDLRRAKEVRLRVRSESPVPMVRGRETPSLRMFAQHRRSPVHSAPLLLKSSPSSDVSGGGGMSGSQLSPGTGGRVTPSLGAAGPYVSPSARGLAPPPTDQPVTNPASTGIEGEVDHATIQLMRNMETGQGAAGEYNCAKCGQPIGGGRPGCSALDKTYHLECFTCTVCNGRLAGGSFYSVDGKPYCEKDYMDTLEKCNVCQKPIMDRILRASGKPYHPACFTCTACGKGLDGVPFTVDSNNAIHCVDCFHEKYAPRCARCGKPIVPEEGKEESLRVVAMDKSFHVDCYRCEDCNKSLNSKIDGHGCYPLDDHILCKDCNMARVQAMSK